MSVNAPAQEPGIYSAINSLPMHAGVEERMIAEFLPSFDGVPYLTWTIFTIWIVSSVFLALFIDQWFISKGRSL